MKKAFIQKLSIAMASAMVITAAVPATADAASKMTMTKKSKTLYLNEDNMTNTSDTFDFGIKNKPAGYKSKYKFTWYAEDNSIVNVAKGGVVTAKKVGTTTVKCDVKKKSNGKLYTTLSAKVTVKANAETVTIKNAPENNAMTVGATFDFNRTMKAANGGKATDKTEWVTSDETIATVDQNGVVTAVKPGTFTVQAKTYQSKATKAEGYTAESEAVEIKVNNVISAFEATKSNEVKVTFAAPVKDLKNTDFVVKNTTNSNRSYVSAVKLSDDGLTAILSLYDNLTSGVTYSVTVSDMTKTLDFVKGEVASIECEDQTIPSLKQTDVKFVVRDTNGLDITADVKGNCIMTATTGKTSDFGLTMGNGVYSVVTITYTNPKTGNTIVSRAASVKASDKAITGILTTTIEDDTHTNADFTKNNMTMSVGTGKKLFVQVTDQYGNKVQAASGTAYAVTFETVSPEIVVVHADGTLKGVKAGTGYVRITAPNNISTLVSITVKDAANAATMNITSKPGSLSGYGDVAKLNYPKLNVLLKDQYGEDYKTGASIKVEYLSGDKIFGDANTGVLATVKTDGVTAVSNVFNGDVALPVVAKGSAMVKVTYTDKNNKVFTQNVNVSVSDIDNVATAYGIDGLNTLDVNHAYGNTTTGNSWEAGNTTLKAYTKNAAGFYVDQVKYSETNDTSDANKNNLKLTFEIVKPDGSTQTLTGTSYDVQVKATADAGKVSIGEQVGTYTVNIKSENITLQSGTFTVVDSITKPVITLEKNSVTGGNLVSALHCDKAIEGEANAVVTGLKYAFDVNDASKVTTSNEVKVNNKSYFTVSGAASKAELYNVDVLYNFCGRTFTTGILGHISVK